MKTIVIGDVHGCFNELRDLILSLEEGGEYNKDTDKLIFLGDYIDRGKDSRLVIEFIRNLQKNNDNVIALRGNHEDMLLSYYKGLDSWWEWNGCETTLKSYEGFDGQLNDDIKWIKSLPLYHEDEHFVYVHAGIDIKKPMEEQDNYTMLWVREPFIYDEEKYYKRVVFGHTYTLYLNGSDKPIYTFNDNIGIDTGCVYGGSLSALVIEDGEVKGFHQIKSENKDENIYN